MREEIIKGLGITKAYLENSYIDMFMEAARSDNKAFKEIFERTRTISDVSIGAVTPLAGDENAFKASYLVYLDDENRGETFDYVIRRKTKENFENEYRVRYNATEIGKQTYKKLNIGESTTDIQIYPELLSSGFKPYREKGLMLEGFVEDATFHQRMYKDPLHKTELDKTVKFTYKDFHLPLNPLVLHHWLLRAHLKEKEVNIKKKKDKVIPDLRRVPTMDYVTEIFSAMYDLGMVNKEIEEPLKELTNHYLTNENLESIIHDNAYPWTNTNSCLLDAGNVKIGSIALDIGALVGGFPAVFNNLKGDVAETIERIAEDYLWKANQLKRERCVSLQTVRYLENIEIEQKLLENAIYFGAVYSNLKRAVKLLRKKDQKFKQEIKEHKDAAMKQLGILAYRDGIANELMIRLEIKSS